MLRAASLICLLAALLPGPARADTDLCTEEVAGAGLQVAVDLTRRLARPLGLAAPAWVRVAPVPDLAAGVTFGPVIRLRPAPVPILLATLLHETGHLGPRRSRDVEEAIGDLTRRALLAAMLDEEPGRAVQLLAVLVPPSLGQDDFNGLPAPDTLPVHDAALYRHAYLLAAALWDRAGPPPAGKSHAVADRLARAAVLGRTLHSSQVRDLLPRSAQALRELQARFAAGHILPLLRQALPLAGRRDPQVRLLLSAVEDADDTAGWLAWAQQALTGDDADRILAHEVLGRRLPGFQGELMFLDAWVDRARRESAVLSLQRARVRRGTALGLAGRPEAAANELAEVLLASPAPFLAMEAAVGLARFRALPADDLRRLLDLAPSLSACGAAGTAFKALALKEAGFSRVALDLFSHGHLPAPAWAWTAAWAEALAAAGNRAGAVALMRRQAESWRRRLHEKVPAAAALMAAVSLEEAGDGRSAWDAARALERAGGWPDGMLAEAGRRWQDSGHERKALRAWRRLLRRVPQSDQAPAARVVLAGTDQPVESLSVSGPVPDGRVMKQVPPMSRAEM
jgi:hypothetical protein